MAFRKSLEKTKNITRDKISESKVQVKREEPTETPSQCSK